MISNSIRNYNLNFKNCSAKIATAIFLLLIFSLAGVNAKSVKKETQKVIQLATYQYASNSRLENLKPLGEVIAKITGCKVETKSYAAIDEFVEAIKQDKVDIALISTMGYLLLKKDQGLKHMDAAFSLLVPNNATDQYKTAFVASSNSKINSLNNLGSLKSIHLGLVSPSSTSGNSVPRLILDERGCSPIERKFGDVIYFGSHLQTIDAVANGQVDIAALGSAEYFNYIKAPSQRKKIKLLYLSPEIPLGPVLLNKKLTKTIKEQLQNLFLQMHINNKETLSAIKEGWTEARDADRYVTIDSSYYETYVNRIKNKSIL